ncbi:MAG: restriction endonuclease subunit S [Crocinitomicaceae bacterium]|nr:restriction endonuclease subunit S [Flavobacteriales bacterium]NQZ34068.1 restriction endonuclease subunit S [Crocinitomicaceae bacterium]
MREIDLGSSVELITKGSTPTTLGKDFVSNGIKFLRAQNVINGKVLLNDDILFIDDQTHTSVLKRSQIKRGDVLVTIAGTIGRTAIVEESQELNCNQAIAIIRLGVSEIYPNYLCHFISSPNAQEQFNRGKVTATIPNLSLGQVKKLKIPLPPLEVQKKITSVLDAADAYRQKTKSLIVKYDELTQSLFLDMFGDPVKNEKGWNYKILDDCLNFLTSGSRGWAKYYSETGSIFLRIQNIGYNALRLNDLTYVNAPESAESKRTKVESGDLLLTITADLGRTGVIPNNFPECYINQHLAILRLNDFYNPLFVSSYIASRGGQSMFLKLDKGGVKAGLNFVDIKTYKIFDVLRKVQDQFVKRLTEIEAQKVQAQQSLEKAEELFNSLLQKAFNGELV